MEIKRINFFHEKVENQRKPPTKYLRNSIQIAKTRIKMD